MKLSRLGTSRESRRRDWRKTRVITHQQCQGQELWWRTLPSRDLHEASELVGSRSPHCSESRTKLLRHAPRVAVSNGRLGRRSLYSFHQPDRWSCFPNSTPPAFVECPFIEEQSHSDPRRKKSSRSCCSWEASQRQMSAACSAKNGHTAPAYSPHN